MSFIDPTGRKIVGGKWPSADIEVVRIETRKTPETPIRTTPRLKALGETNRFRVPDATFQQRCHTLQSDRSPSGKHQCVLLLCAVEKKAAAASCTGPPKLAT